MKFADYPDSERAVAVSAFDARFGATALPLADGQRNLQEVAGN